MRTGLMRRSSINQESDQHRALRPHHDACRGRVFERAGRLCELCGLPFPLSGLNTRQWHHQFSRKGHLVREPLTSREWMTHGLHAITCHQLITDGVDKVGDRLLGWRSVDRTLEGLAEMGIVLDIEAIDRKLDRPLWVARRIGKALEVVDSTGRPLMDRLWLG